MITLWLRPHYMSAVTVTYKLLSGFTPTGSYWQLTSEDRAYAVDPGHRVRLRAAVSRARQGPSLL